MIVAVILSGVWLWLVGESASATNGQTWSTGEVRLSVQAPTLNLPPHHSTCHGMTMQVHIRSTGNTTACVTGEPDKTRFARYESANGQFAYAIALSDDTEYTRLAYFCEGLSWCVYSSSTDTLLWQVPVTWSRNGHVVVQNFSHYLVKHTMPEPHYTVEYDEPNTFIGTGTAPLYTGAAAVSPNGKWAVVELMEFGFVRVNMETGAYRRVVAPGATYGQGSDPSFELAVSNDGQYMAVVGRRAGIDVYEMSGSCGDILTEASQRYFLGGVVGCRASSIERYALFPNFISAHVPRFSNDGTKLSLYVSTPAVLYRATLTPLPNVDVSTAPLYVALGDSFASGEGETDDHFYIAGTNTPSNRCHVSTRSYPYLLHPALTMEARNDACSGARTVEVAVQGRLLEAASERPVSFISIGVGGNDVNLMGKLKTCLGLDTCEWAAPEKRIQTAQEIQALYPKVVKLLTDIQQMHPSAKLFFVGYPKVVNDAADAHCRLPISLLLNETERRYMNATIEYLNGVLLAAAQYIGVQFVDVADAYHGVRLCDETEDAMNGIRIGDDFAPITALDSLKMIGAESFHPTPKGHTLVAQRIQEVLTAEGLGVGCEACVYAPTDISPATYWHEDAPLIELPRLVASSFLQSSPLFKGHTVRASFPKGSFMPHEVIRLEIHSESRLLTELTADSEGELTGTFVLPDDLTGYHTVHALGRSLSGEAIDRYEIVHIGERAESSQGFANVVAPVATKTQSPSSTATRHSPGLTQGLAVGAITPQLQSSGASVKGSSSVGKPIAFFDTDTASNVARAFIWAGVGMACLIAGVLAYAIGRRRV